MSMHKIWMAIIGVALFLLNLPIAQATTPVDYQALPVIGATAQPPLVMLVLDREHKLYYEAYNDASDLNGDGQLDVGYWPATVGNKPGIDYYGYFDSHMVYKYSSANKRFEPLRATADKKVNPAANDEWSGDFLNYLTMSRMDAMRKVLYGGYRSTDTAAETVLERAYIPQDAHTWGKEYQSIARDKFDIRDYSPLELPDAGTYHLFASTSLADPSNAAYQPLLRVLPNNAHRIWEWVAKERPVADGSLVSAGGFYNQHPANHSGFETMVTMFANAAHLQGSSAATQINGSGNPNNGAAADDNYMTIFNGTLNITTAGNYQFSVDGDDAVEVIIDGIVVAGWYNGHGSCGSSLGCRTDHPDRNGTIALAAGAHTLKFHHEELSGGDNYYLYWNGPGSGNVWQIVPTTTFTGLTQTNYTLATSGSTITDYVVRVKVGVSEALHESNCKRYANGSYKPTGLLQRYGETGRMKFGLMTGSYKKNTSGGVLRKNIDSFTDEVDCVTTPAHDATGQFTATIGIVRTIDKLRIVNFSYDINGDGIVNGDDYSYNVNCGWVTTRAINEGECRLWGNPIGEMMYETIRYFAGKAAPTGAFDYVAAGSDDAALGLPKPAWVNPYAANPYCAKPFMLVISDINPSFDSDQLPGSAFGGIAGDLVPAMNVSELADKIGDKESATGNYFIGESGGIGDGACTVKNIVGGLGNVRGLCPEEPTKQGSYYSASVAYYGHINDVNATASENQFVSTFAVGLASPLPRIEIPIAGKTVTLVPFAKSVGGYGISAAEHSFQPTDTIVDFFVEEIGSTHGKFRINYEDVEQGADHDMDAIVTYEYQVVDAGGNAVADPALGVSVDIKLSSDYAAGSIIQHMGYIISGTTKDGTYLEVRDSDTTAGSDVQYFLDTPPGVDPGGVWNDGVALPLVTTRRFSPNAVGGAAPAKLLKNPLWYAAKWGGFVDQDTAAALPGHNLPDKVEEWDKKPLNHPDGEPDNYFYVTNPLRLEQQLSEAFSDILATSASGTSASVVSTTKEGEATLVQAYFRPLLAEGTEEVHWVGFLQSLWIDSKGFFREDTDGDHALDITKDYVIVYTVVDGVTKVNRFAVTAAKPFPDIALDTPSTIMLEDIKPIWEAGRVLRDTAAADRNIYTTVDGTALISFSSAIAADVNAIKPFLGVKQSDVTYFSGANIDSLGADEATRATNLINYIRGTDAPGLGLRNRTIDGNVWKLGDIVYSTPVTVSKPVEQYHVIYSDQSYNDYFLAKKNRQTVVYVGANDGMLHAFTSWKFDSTTSKFVDTGERFGLHQGETIGDELWAYIPKAVLPHLKWLSDPEYTHTYYVDLTPKVFDAKIGGAGKNEWGTFLLVGLNMGGKDISLDLDADAATRESTSSPSYSLIDVTDPVNPKLMWERSYEGLGMSRSEPVIIKIGGEIRGADGLVNSPRGEKWLAVFGSGPTDYDGLSDQPGRVYVVDLKTGAPMRDVALHDYLFTTSDNASVSSVVALDKGLDYEVDAIYFGETINPAAAANSPWTGKAWSIDTYGTKTDPADPTTWTVSDSTTNWHLHFLMEEFKNAAGDLQKIGPITAPMALSTDSFGHIWVYFGTGRYLYQSDKADANPQALFGLKDPLFNSERNYTLADFAVAAPQGIDAALLNSSKYRYDSVTRKVLTDTGATFGDWEDLLKLVRKDGGAADVFTDGWVRPLTVCSAAAPCPAERCISKFAVFGGSVFVPTFIPSVDVCKFGGTSYLYGLYYETGTNFIKPLLSGTTEAVKPLGETTPPPKIPIHVDAAGKARLEAQLGSGEIKSEEAGRALKNVSHIGNWID
jgi:type IV pilus assembly protein PilY1